MALSILQAGHKVIHLLNKYGVELDSHTEQQLKIHGYSKIGGYNCLITNVVGQFSFRVRVHKSWFKENRSGDLKPTLSNSREEFDFQLIPTKNVLYTLYYQALKDYAMQLEVDKEKWFNEPRWGIEVNEDKGIFVWKGGNTLQFPLTPFQCIQALSIREKQYVNQRRMAT